MHTFTDIPLQIILQLQILEHIIKANLKFTHFLRTNCLFFVGF